MTAGPKFSAFTRPPTRLGDVERELLGGALQERR